MDLHPFPSDTRLKKPVLQLNLVKYRKNCIRHMVTHGDPIFEPVTNVAVDTAENYCPICLDEWDSAEAPEACWYYSAYYDNTMNENSGMLWDVAYETRNKWYSRLLPFDFCITKTDVSVVRNHLTTLYPSSTTANRASLVKIAACKHVFHHSCLRPWVTQHKSCPMCRVVLRNIPHPVGFPTREGDLPEGVREIDVAQPEEQPRRSFFLHFWPRRHYL